MIRLSEERLCHLSCEYCKQWYSIGDLNPFVTHLRCPNVNCASNGKPQRVKIKDKDKK